MLNRAGQWAGAPNWLDNGLGPALVGMGLAAINFYRAGIDRAAQESGCNGPDRHKLNWTAMGRAAMNLIRLDGGPGNWAVGLDNGPGRHELEWAGQPYVLNLAGHRARAAMSWNQADMGRTAMNLAAGFFRLPEETTFRRYRNRLGSLRF